MRKCTTLNELKKHTSDKGCYCFIKKGGALITKHIIHSDVSGDIYSSISCSYISYETDEEFFDKEPFIFNSMKEGSLYLDLA